MHNQRSNFTKTTFGFGRTEFNKISWKRKVKFISKLNFCILYTKFFDGNPCDV